jgi:hypothetical protein
MRQRAMRVLLIVATAWGIAVASTAPADAQGGGCILRHQSGTSYSYHPGK